MKIQTANLSIILQSGFIMHSSPNFQISDLFKNVPEVIKYKKGVDIKITTQLYPYLCVDNERRTFYTSYNREDEQENINFNHCKIPTVYCPPRYRNLLSIHMLSELSSKHQKKKDSQMATEVCPSPRGLPGVSTPMGCSRLISLTLEECPQLQKQKQSLTL